MSRLTWRPMGREDLAELEQLLDEHARFEQLPFGSRDRSSGLDRTLLDNDRAFAWVVQGEGELAGYAVAFLQHSTLDAGDYLYLDCLFLRPPYRRLGLGRELLAVLARLQPSVAPHGLQWQTPPWNQPAIAFYRAAGAVDRDKVRFHLPASACAELAGTSAPC